MPRSAPNRLRNRSTTSRPDPHFAHCALFAAVAAFVLAGAPAFAQTPVVEWGLSSLTLAEGLDGRATVTVNPAPTKAIRVPITDASDDATFGSSCGSGADYVVPSAVDIPAGATSATVPVEICYDAVIESPDEKFTLTLEPVAQKSAPFSIGSKWSLRVGITESTRTVDLSASPTTLDAGSAVTVTVTPSGAGPGGTIPLSITRGTAEADDLGTPGTLSLPAGKNAGTTTVPTRVDVDADDETFTVALGSSLPLPYIAGSKTSVEITVNDIVSLAPPINLTIDPTADVLRVSWMAPVGITPTSYDVHYTAATTSTAADDAAAGTNPATQWVPAGTGPTTRMRQTISGLTAEKHYRVRVRSRHGSTTSDWVHEKAATWLLWVHSEPRCGTTVTDTTVKPRIAIGLTPRPSEDVHTEYRWIGNRSFGKWQVGETIPSSGLSARKGFDSFADLVGNIKDFVGFQWRGKDLPNVRGICTWTIRPTEPEPEPEPEPDVAADLSVTPNPVAEGSAVTVTATLAAARSSNVTIPLIITDASPDKVDYGTFGGIEIASGSTSGSRQIQTLQDADANNEQFKVQFGPLPAGVTSGTTTKIEITITDDEGDQAQRLAQLVTLSLAPNPVDEGSPVTVTATLSEAASSNLTIPVTITDNTAESGDHGTLTSISISSGATTGTGTITTNQDDDADDETFTVALGTLPSPLAAGTPSSVQVTINDDDATPPSVPELDDFAMTLTADRQPAEGGGVVTVTLDLGIAAPSGFFARLKGAGTARYRRTLGNHIDWTTDPTMQVNLREAGFERVVTLRDWGSASKRTIAITVNDDDLVDPDETIVLQATGYNMPVPVRNGAMESNELTLTIADNDGDGSSSTETPLEVGVLDTFTRETGNTRDNTARVRVWLNRPADEAVTVDYATADGTARSNGTVEAGTLDYTAVSGTLTFAAGDTRKEVEVAIKDDTVEDSWETFRFRLSNPTPSSLVNLSDAEATVTIINDEADLEGLKLWGAPDVGGPYARLGLGAFDAAVSNYAVTVPHGTTHAKLAGVAPQNARLGLKTGQAGTQLTAVQSDVAGPAVALAVGDTVLVVQATAPSGERKTYRVTVTRQARVASANADLTGLTAETGADGSWSALDIGTFSAATTEYTATVPHATTQARLTATTADTNATLRAGTGSSLSAVTSGTASAAIALEVGTNALSVEVTAEDGTTKTYSVTVTREARVASSNADLAGLSAETGSDGSWSALGIGTFSAATTEYSATVPHGTTQARLTATTADANATLRAGIDSSLSAVSSGSASAAISLDVGANALSVEVTAEDGTKKTYGVRVERSAPPKPLTASFENVPEEHDGKAAFTLDVRFSEPLGTGASRPTAASFDRQAGKVEEVEDLGSGVWRVKVQPGSWRDVTVGMTGGRDCSTAGSVCTADGRALENTVEASVGGPVRIRIEGGKAREGQDAGIDFAVTLNRASTVAVSVDYATADGTAKAGEDYEAVSGTLTFAAGETEKTVQVPILDDDIDEGNEKFEMRLSNESGAYLRGTHKKATGTIRNTDLIPGALLARFGRATAEQVVTQIEERMAAPRRRGFRARFAGRELRPGQERDFALGLVSQFAPMGMGSHAGASPLAGAAPMGMGSHAARAGAFGMGTGGMSGASAMGAAGGGMGMTGMGAAGGAMGMGGMGGMPGAMGMTGQHAPMGGYGPADGMHGGGLYGSMGMGGDLFSSSELELNRESRGGMLSLWSRSSRSHFSGMENALSLNGDVRTTMVGADYSRGALTVGLSVGRTLGLGGYRGTSGGQMSTSMTGVYPWVGYQVNDRVSVWGTTGYGTGSLSLTPDAASALETGVSMMMSAVGTRGELLGSRATGGFALAFKADALRVGAASDLVEGPAGRLNASEAAVTRVRTALEGSRGFTLGGGRLSLRPTVEVGVRQDGGDAETGAGMDVGGGLAFSDTVTGLSLDVRMRTLVVHQAEGFSERGLSLSFGWDATPSSPLGLMARVAPSWGGSAQSGAETLWSSQTAYGMGSHQMYGSGGQVAAEVGYGLPVGTRFVGTPRVGLTTSEYGRDYRVGYGLGVVDRGNVNFELGVDAQRRESPMHGEASNGFMGRGTLGW